MNTFVQAFALLLGIAGLCVPVTVAGQQVAPVSAISLKKADFGVATQTRTTLSMWWAKEVERRSNGRLKIQYFPADSLVKASDVFESTRSGVIDIGIWVPAYNPAVSPMSALFAYSGAT